METERAEAGTRGQRENESVPAPPPAECDRQSQEERGAGGRWPRTEPASNRPPRRAWRPLRSGCVPLDDAAAQPLTHEFGCPGPGLQARAQFPAESSPGPAPTPNGSARPRCPHPAPRGSPRAASKRSGVGRGSRAWLEGTQLRPRQRPASALRRSPQWPAAPRGSSGLRQWLWACRAWQTFHRPAQRRDGYELSDRTENSGARS